LLPVSVEVMLQRGFNENGRSEIWVNDPTKRSAYALFERAA
jgi:hypothetical protein